MKVKVNLLNPVKVDSVTQTLSVMGENIVSDKDGVLLTDNDGTKSWFIPWHNVGAVDYKVGQK